MNSVEIKIDESSLTNMILSYYGGSVIDVKYILSNIYDDLYLDRYYDGKIDVKPRVYAKVVRCLNAYKIEEKLDFYALQNMISTSLNMQGYNVISCDVMMSYVNIDFRDSYRKFSGIRVKAIENTRVRVR